MAKSKKEKQQEQSAPASLFAPKSNSVDPALASLFASSSGPVKVPVKASKPVESVTHDVESTTNNEEGLNASLHPETDAQEPAKIFEDTVERPRKRRRTDKGDDLETKYFEQLEREEEKEHKRKQPSKSTAQAEASDPNDSLHSDLEDVSEDDAAVDDVPRHETRDQKSDDEDKVKRTVFLGNVSTEAIKSKSARKTLIQHLESGLKVSTDGQSQGKFDSIRFRSTAYVSSSGPKKATFAKKELMDETTVSTNAYAVFSTEEATRRVASKLNGTIVLDRHLRADYLGSPSKIDHKRCVFIGNLSFVNQETNPEEDADGNKRRPTAKQPADAEEGLWRAFSKVGKVESVRVVRDQETRVSKGFAYVQFENENSVEAALLMNEKKFPPMLPRKLRVMRAKKTKQSTAPNGRPADRPEERMKGSAASRSRSAPRSGQRKPGVVFEGYRASSTTKTNLAKKRHKKRPDTRSSRRGAAYKASGGRK
ncbi:Nucleolar protein 12 [Elasticomyces elasticus]|uniref:Nucleolar protein 12 n=1 Tax=Exophiala sideris TaxID=1016849 RepID=A0ABR0IXJ6_9EURO|nr:Nucleolar protein 12 [Elasticomyces elasticus]KAK5022373.1 Nucleolar protein 12 [Exophiala sideris]KAK5027269.1 Nucleolar protein 12 [Exophiala sideris]KAK5051227.1 Nucleolar protein 12 [Exophiala sideris]KAK5177809.1 Nucleolar protein 12 [Eurotiomycetes sp. CCFEE 6388]